MMASTVAVLSLVGLAIDTGHLQLAKIRMQTAADAAALGAVQERKNNSAADFVAPARADAAFNGFTHGQNGVSVTVNSPPVTGFYTADSTAVEVLIHRDVKTFFMALGGFHTMGVKARSVARRGPGTTCMHILDPTASSAVSASGGAIVQVNCGVHINSSSNTALSVSGGARITATQVNIVGSYSASGGGVISPAPAIHVATEPDPLAHVPAPAAGACTSTNYSVSGAQVRTISEGVYCGGISVSGGSRLTLNPGTYILKGGGLSVSGGSYLTGAGVTFYNTFAAGYSYGAISLSGGTYNQLSAPTTGPLAGILFFQDRSLTSGAASSLSGGATSRFDGALYFPKTALSYSGGTGTEYTIIVAKTLSFSGGTILNNNYSSLPAGPPVKGNATLSE
jgi:Flp pilus assembly protein TadG